MRRNIFQASLLIGIVTLGTGCEIVRMEPGAAQVRVLPIGQSMESCQRLGELSVSIQDRVGPYERNTVAVRDELETLARNEALTLHADTILPKTEPANGQQRWLAYRCQGRR
jgi:hypothetical protein